MFPSASRSLAALAALTVGLALPGLAPASAAPQRVQLRVAPSATASAYAVIGHIALPSGFTSQLAVSNDDTVYVASGSGGSYVGIINPRVTSGSLSSSFSITNPNSVAVSDDDTVYVMQMDSGNRQVSVRRPDGTQGYTIGTGGPMYSQVAVNADETVVMSGNWPSLSIVSPNSASIAATIGNVFGVLNTEMSAVNSTGDFFVGGDSAVGTVKKIPRNGLAVTATISVSPYPMALDFNSDDTMFVLGRTNNQVNVVAPGASSTAYTVPVGNTPVAIAVSNAGDAFVANYISGTISRIAPNAQTSQTVISGLTSPHAVAVTSSGIVYASNNTSPPQVVTAASLTSSLAPTSGSAGASLSVAINGLPSGALMDDTTVQAVWWGDDTVPFTRPPSSNAVGITVPSGTGNVPVVVQFASGGAVTSGTFTYVVPPVPPTPATAPVGASAEAEDGGAMVSWSAPASSGSYPVSSYQVTSSPAGGSCLVAAPALSCEVTGLTNGTAYTFTVKALTGAGWSVSSAPSNAVTPQAAPRPSVMITGARSGDRIEVSGTTTGFGMGGTLRPWLRFPGQSAYSEGTATILVSMDGTFEWGRRTGKRVSVYMQTPEGSLRSNAVTILAR
jgi:hypothetical protein